MSEWYSADYVLKKYNEQIDHDFMYGAGSIHAKYSEFIKIREQRLKEEQEAYQKMLQERAERKARKAQQELDQSERLC